MRRRVGWLLALCACRCTDGVPPRAAATPAPQLKPAPTVAPADAGAPHDAAESGDALAEDGESGAASAPQVRGFEKLVASDRPAPFHGAAQRQGDGSLVVFLHGMCAIPEWECPVFRAAADHAWLLCPPGPALCNGGGRMWVGTDKRLRGHIERHEVELGAARKLQFQRRYLIGYSLGGPAALRVVMAEPERWRGLMIVNASAHPSAAQLAKAKQTRVALVSGQRDRTSSKLQRAAQRLSKAGFDVRYFQLESTGHFFDQKSAARMAPALAWLTQEAAE